MKLFSTILIVNLRNKNNTNCKSLLSKTAIPYFLIDRIKEILLYTTSYLCYYRILYYLNIRFK